MLADSHGLGGLTSLTSSLPSASPFTYSVPPSVVCAIPQSPTTEAQRLPYYATYCPTRLLIHSMCTSHYLDIFITFIICLNVVTMSLEHYNQPTVSPSPAPSPRSHGGAGGERTHPRDRVGQDLSSFSSWALGPTSDRTDEGEGKVTHSW